MMVSGMERKVNITKTARPFLEVEKGFPYSMPASGFGRVFFAENFNFVKE
jgi:hypothetical protein